MQDNSLTHMQEKGSFIQRYRTYLIDVLVFVAVLIFNYRHFLQRFYAPFFLDESSEAFMQFTYYMHALRSNMTPFWDTYINLASVYFTGQGFI